MGRRKGGGKGGERRERGRGERGQRGEREGRQNLNAVDREMSKSLFSLCDCSEVFLSVVVTTVNRGRASGDESSAVHVIINY